MTSEEPAGVAYNAVPTQDQRWTYGYRLIQNTPEGQEHRDNFTPALCETIAKCLMHRQEHRPDLVQLQADITNALGNAPPRLPARVRRFFGNDPPLPVPWYSAYTDVDLQHMDPFDPYPDVHDEDLVDPPAPSPPRKRRRTRQVPLMDRAYQD
ncbi:hypothetical protein UCDDA912_g00936 [Diaporthe ampelina]|uniref:Uncharacterized protein n=1 Tax=Diaporthe ampelina TaxID=1214573 RepID=A0A0G2FYT6_9PEZI|nr:hypothetical protein UCDDA912_g00936 [Diaporthe ampelina]